MRGMQVGFALLALMATGAEAPGQGRKAVPVGLVMGAGATVTRDKQTGAIKPGEVLFAGDVMKAGSTGVPFLFCPQKFSAVVAAGGQVVFEEKELSGAVENRKAVSACFLPAVQKLSVASQQHFGVMMTRAGSIPAPATTFNQRAQALPADKRSALEAELAAAKVDDPGMSAVRGAALEKAGLLYDAYEAYRTFSRTFDEAAWVKRKIIELENQLMREQAK